MALSKALEEIEAYFEMEWGFSLGKAKNQPQLTFDVPQDGKSSKEEPEEKEAREDSEDMYGDEGEDSSGERVFDREEIEVAIDVFLSTLVQERIIPKYPDNKPPTLEQVFQRVLGDRHKIIKVVHDFEQHIEGYFDVVAYGDMESAANELSEIRDMINKELGD